MVCIDTNGVDEVGDDDSGTGAVDDTNGVDENLVGNDDGGTGADDDTNGAFGVAFSS